MTDHSPGGSAGVRIPPPTYYAVGLLLGWLLQRLLPLPALPLLPGRVLGAVCALAGLVLGFWCIWLFRQARTSVLPDQPTTALVFSGPYRITRNPIYLGLLLAFIGFALWFGLTWALLLAPVVVAVIQRRVIAREEAYLAATFGDDYRAYMRRVRRWL